MTLTWFLNLSKNHFIAKQYLKSHSEKVKRHAIIINKTCLWKTKGWMHVIVYLWGVRRTVIVPWILFTLKKWNKRKSNKQQVHWLESYVFFAHSNLNFFGDLYWLVGWLLWSVVCFVFIIVTSALCYESFVCITET